MPIDRTMFRVYNKLNKSNRTTQTYNTEGRYITWIISLRI